MDFPSQFVSVGEEDGSGVLVAEHASAVVGEFHSFSDVIAGTISVQGIADHVVRGIVDRLQSGRCSDDDLHPVPSASGCAGFQGAIFQAAGADLCGGEWVVFAGDSGGSGGAGGELWDLWGGSGGFGSVCDGVECAGGGVGLMRCYTDDRKKKRKNGLDPSR